MVFSRFVFSMFLILATVGCSTQKLSVHSEYYNNQQLASYIVGTPDPQKNTPFWGQRLIIAWDVPSQQYIPGKTTLNIFIKYKNGEEKVMTFPLKQRTGKHVQTIFETHQNQTKSFLSYLICIKNDDLTIIEKRHKLWVENVDLKEESEILNSL